MRRCRGLFRPSDASFRLQFSADYTITMFGFDFRQGQATAAAYLLFEQMLQVLRQGKTARFARSSGGLSHKRVMTGNADYRRQDQVCAQMTIRLKLELRICLLARQRIARSPIR